jgi:uncharacterized membrane protein
MILVEIDSGVPGYGGKFIVALIVFIACDAVWLRLATGLCCEIYPIEDMSREQQEHTRRRTVPAVVLNGLLASLITPIFVADTSAEAASLGALLGLLVFGCFNIVEYALWSKWTVTTALADTAYGAVVYALALAMQQVVAS